MSKKEGKQTEMEFPYVYDIKEMGVVVYEKLVHLFDSFLRDKLGASMLDARSFFQKSEPTKVGCPFCKKGFLRLENVQPEYSGGPHPVPMNMRHVGNKYEYGCSNSECGARFFGTYTWMHID